MGRYEGAAPEACPGAARHARRSDAATVLLMFLESFI
jgi:hypothetical protein